MMSPNYIKPLVLLLLLWSSIGHAASPNVMGYNGTLMDEDGNPVDTNIDLVIRICDAPQDGSCYLQQSFASTLVTTGYFEVLVDGDENELITAIPLHEIFAASQNLFIELEVENDILSPRQRITSVPYAFSSTIQWTDIVGRPTGLDDSGSMTLAGLSASNECNVNDLVRRTQAGWECVTPDNHGGGLPGADGVEGPQGPQGFQGPQGPGCFAEEADGGLFIVCGGESFFLPPGNQGPQGNPGPNGLNSLLKVEDQESSDTCPYGATRTFSWLERTNNTTFDSDTDTLLSSVTTCKNPRTILGQIAYKPLNDDGTSLNPTLCTPITTSTVRGCAVQRQPPDQFQPSNVFKVDIDGYNPATSIVTLTGSCDKSQLGQTCSTANFYVVPHLLPDESGKFYLFIGTDDSTFEALNSEFVIFELNPNLQALRINIQINNP